MVVDLLRPRTINLLEPAVIGDLQGRENIETKNFKLLSIKADEAVILWDFILYKHKEIETICYNV